MSERDEFTEKEKPEKVRTYWKGSDPPTHFPSGEPIPPETRERLRRAYLKTHPEKK